MSDPRMQRRGRPVPMMPTGDVLGTYATYPEAQSVVDRLSKAEFDVSRLAIMGNDLKTVERVTGRLSYGRTALGGAASGAWFGLFLGLLLFIFAPEPNILVVLSAMLIGAGFGVLFSLTSHALNRRQRDFTSTHTVLASNYQIVIDPTLTAQAQQVLQQHPEQRP